MLQLIDKKKKILIYLIFLLIFSTTSGKFFQNQKGYLFIIDTIKVQGLSSHENKKIFDQLNNLLFKNILIIRKEEVKEVIEQHNIIEEYSVKKIYPSTIKIDIKPTKFIARVSYDKNLLVGANGKLIKKKINGEILPFIFGEFNSKEFLILTKIVESSKFNFAEFKTLYFFPSHRWDILTNEGILIKLPNTNFSSSLNLAHKVISNDFFKEKKLIDLRADRHLIVK
tara:strand:+ start:434 stop:1111 length:678 start_codon:yes stop_codon:yes gene_type:complete